MLGGERRLAERGRPGRPGVAATGLLPLLAQPRAVEVDGELLLGQQLGGHLSLDVGAERVGDVGAELLLVDRVEEAQAVLEAPGAGDPLLGPRVVELVLAGAVQQHLEALHHGGLARALAGEDVQRDDTGDPALDGPGRVQHPGPVLGPPVRRQSRLLEDLLVEPQPAGVRAVRDAVGPAVLPLGRGLRGRLELPPVVPGAEVVVQRTQQPRLDIGVDQEGVLVDHVRCGPRGAHHLLDLGVVVVLRRLDRDQPDLLAGVALLELPCHEADIVVPDGDLAVGVLDEGDLDGVLVAPGPAAAGGERAGGHDGGGQKNQRGGGAHGDLQLTTAGCPLKVGQLSQPVNGPTTDSAIPGGRPGRTGALGRPGRSPRDVRDSGGR